MDTNIKVLHLLVEMYYGGHKKELYPYFTDIDNTAGNIIAVGDSGGAAATGAGGSQVLTTPLPLPSGYNSSTVEDSDDTYESLGDVTHELYPDDETLFVDDFTNMYL